MRDEGEMVQEMTGISSYTNETHILKIYILHFKAFNQSKQILKQNSTKTKQKTLNMLDQ